MKPQRVFTLDEANRTLPYLRRVVTDLVRDYHAWKDALNRYEVAVAQRRAAEDGGPGDDGKAQAMEREVITIAEAIESYLAEIAAVGAEATGFRDGLVDFPGERDGRAIRWCWMLGEPSITHWHFADAGFEGRQPLDSLVQSATD